LEDLTQLGPGWKISVNNRSVVHVCRLAIKRCVKVAAVALADTASNPGSSFHDASFIVWVIVATITSTYTSTWDLVIDWSLFRPDSGFLRHELGYSKRYVCLLFHFEGVELSVYEVYYVAMVTNVLIRFVWVWSVSPSVPEANSNTGRDRYIPDSAKHTRLRSFFFALAEMLRRWQWNFCETRPDRFGGVADPCEVRVETEHLGNADAYRVSSCISFQKIA
jgi:hypothetical protein